ncbi:hypothetical protein RhiJN_08178 [Ceratobasidium sp. AG-Ba]|nr:hypothetical protein RhiJN_08178 [Ceratobasidium sp. AG-Ba]QRW08958.1 hypothetical protein RhiLY_07957 [Ceratobasidium sp. AG-Ba]
MRSINFLALFLFALISIFQVTLAEPLPAEPLEIRDSKGLDIAPISSSGGGSGSGSSSSKLVCPAHWGFCPNDPGYCCPLGGRCCGGHWCCKPGYYCFKNFWGQTRCCPNGKRCWKFKESKTSDDGSEPA